MDWEGYRYIRKEWFYPTLKITPPDPEELDATDQEAVCRLVLAQKLLRGESAGSMPPAYAPALDIHDAVRWCEVPLVIVEGAKAWICTVLLGLLNDSAIRIEPGFLSEKATEAARLALRLAGKGTNGFVLIRGVEPVEIDGGSLALPLASAGHALIEGKSVSSDIIMTGALDENGIVKGVDHVEKKYDCVFRHDGNKRIFFYPAENKNDIKSGSSTNVIQAVNLESTYALYDMCLDNKIDLVRTIDYWRLSPDNFFSDISKNKIPPEAIASLLTIAENENWKEKFGSIRAFGDAIKNLNDCISSNAIENIKYEVNKNIYRFLNLLPDINDTNLYDLDMLQLLRLAGMHMTNDNHKGIVDSPWKDVIDYCIEKTENSNIEIVGEKIVGIIRNDIVASQNRYDFHKGISNKWMNFINHTNQYYSLFDIKKSVTLGKAYGVLTAYNAFLEKFDDALQASKLSMQFFNDPKDILRRYIDNIYIYCDTEKLIDAENLIDEIPSLLLQNTDISELSKERCRFEQIDHAYVHAAFVRLCRKKPSLFSEYPVYEVFKKYAENTKEHPWQCWGNNCGYLLMEAQDTVYARKLFHFAIDICLSNPKRWALFPMALLPLAGLRRFHLEPDEYVLQQTKKVMDLIQEGCHEGKYCKSHFEHILEAEGTEEVLDIVVKEEKILFPFNYR